MHMHRSRRVEMICGSYKIIINVQQIQFVSNVLRRASIDGHHLRNYSISQQQLFSHSSVEQQKKRSKKRRLQKHEIVQSGNYVCTNYV